MIDIKKFDELKKTSAQSFNQQKAMIKKVMAGRTINCEGCGGAIKLVPPESSENPGLFCGKGCTDIELDLSLI